jgi:hypothetical protein
MTELGEKTTTGEERIFAVCSARLAASQVYSVASGNKTPWLKATK